MFGDEDTTNFQYIRGEATALTPKGFENAKLAVFRYQYLLHESYVDFLRSPGAFQDLITRAKTYASRYGKSLEGFQVRLKVELVVLVKEENERWRKVLEMWHISGLELKNLWKSNDKCWGIRKHVKDACCQSYEMIGGLVVVLCWWIMEG
jgi:hypothetical protein